MQVVEVLVAVYVCGRGGFVVFCLGLRLDFVVSGLIEAVFWVEALTCNFLL